MRHIGPRSACVAIGAMLGLCGCADRNSTAAAWRDGAAARGRRLLRDQEEGVLRRIGAMRSTLREVADEAASPTRLTGSLDDLDATMKADMRGGKRSVTTWWRESFSPSAVRSALRESGRDIRKTLAELPG